MLDVRRFRGGLTIYGELYFFTKKLKNTKKLGMVDMDTEFLFAGYYRSTEVNYSTNRLFFVHGGRKYPKAAAQAQHSTTHIASLYAMIPDTLRLIRIDSSQTCALVLTESRETLS
jgi:hypothetical protein